MLLLALKIDRFAADTKRLFAVDLFVLNDQRLI